MGEVIDAGELADVEVDAVVGDLEEFISVESLGVEGAVSDFKTV